MLDDPNVDVVVELIGGEDTAVEVVRRALTAGKSVVTGNKAIIASHGDELVAAAQAAGVNLCFEAAVAGGIPIISAITRSLTGNQIRRIAGIINGTSNFILTAMSERGIGFETALTEAQELGYAEADPTFDVEGIDAAHKLSILAALAFGLDFRADAVYAEGISAVSVEDLEYATQLGYRIKHLGIARAGDDGVELRVHPTLVPVGEPLAGVDGVMNAVLVNGDASGNTMYTGAGAGALPTASAVVGDLIDIATGRATTFAGHRGGSVPIVAMSDVTCAYYLKIPSLDKPGVFAGVATILSEQGISIEAAIQKEQAIHTEAADAWVPIVILTQPVTEHAVDAAIAAVEALPDVVGEITRIRVEQFAES